MDSNELNDMLKVLKEHGVAAFRTKNGEDSFLEIVFKDNPLILEEEDDDEEEMDVVKPTGPYSTSNIGLRFESFEPSDA